MMLKRVVFFDFQGRVFDGVNPAELLVDGLDFDHENPLNVLELSSMPRAETQLPGCLRQTLCPFK